MGLNYFHNFLASIFVVSSLGIFGNLTGDLWTECNSLSNFGNTSNYLKMIIVSLIIILAIVSISFWSFTRDKIGKYLPMHLFLVLIAITAIILYTLITGIKDWTQVGILIATIIYSGITYSLTKFTKDLAETTEKATKLQNQPFMTANLIENEIDYHYIDLIIENIGQGIAKKIKFRLESPDTLKVPSKYHHKIEEMEIFNRGIQSLGPHQKFKFVLVNLPEIIGPEKHISEVKQDDLKFKLTISCENIEGEKSPDQEYVLDLLIFWGLVYIEKPPAIQLMVMPSTKKEESVDN